MMLPPRPADHPREAPIHLRRELLAGGLTDRAIRRLTQTGVLHRVRHGAYVDAQTWTAATDTDRHALVARAVLRQARAEVVLSHLTAAVEWEVPLWDLSPDDVHVTRIDRRAGRHEAGVHQHLGQLGPHETVSLHGRPVTAATRTALDCARTLDLEHGVTMVGDLLHRGLTTVDDLNAGAAAMDGWPGSLGFRPLLRVADGRCESVGEHRTLFLIWKQGLPQATPQHEVRDRHGRLLGRVDFAWPELGVFLEFDGREKYQKYLKKGQSVTDAVVAEKQREHLICRATGWVCIRIVWADLYHPERVAAELRAHFAARTGAAS